MKNRNVLVWPLNIIKYFNWSNFVLCLHQKGRYCKNIILQVLCYETTMKQ